MTDERVQSSLTIYLDAVWTLNLLLDFMLLLITKTLLKEHTKFSRIFLGAFIASLIVPIHIYFPNSFFTTIFGKLLYSLFIVFSSFKFYSVYRMLKLWGMFYVVTFVVGGGLTAIYNLVGQTFILNKQGVLTHVNGYGDPVSWLFVLIAFPIVWMFSKKSMQSFAVDKIRYDQLYPVEISFDEHIYTTTGFIDSGNQLSDPISKSPVVLCDETILQQIFTKSECILLKEIQETLALDRLPVKWQAKLQLIPYQGVGGGTAFLLAMKPNYLAVFYDEEWIKTQKILIGFQFNTLSRDIPYHCLLQPQCVTKYLPNTG